MTPLCEEFDTPASCPHFGTCGGCVLPQMSWEEYAQHKMAEVRSAFERFCLPQEVLRAPHLLKGPWRRRCVLKAFSTPSGVQMGFYQPRSHTVVNMTQCALLTPEIVTLLEPLRVFLKTFLGTGKRAEMAVLHTPTGIDVAMMGKDLPKLSLPLIGRLTQFADEQNLARLRYEGELIVQRQLPLVSFAGTLVEGDALGFVQASAQADAYLTTALLEVLPGSFEKALDLFCGRGLFSFALASRARIVHAFDSDAPALAALTKAAGSLGGRVKAFERNLFTDPLAGKELEKTQGVVLDPPRVGALAQVRALAQAKIPLIVYVSCNPESFARDARVLLGAGYTLTQVQPLDQFLWSSHIELMAVFKKT